MKMDLTRQAWEDGNPSEWEGHLGHHNIQDAEHHIPDAVRQLMTPTQLRNFDVSRMGFGSDNRRGEELNIPSLQQPG
jgi:hypothetical protein